VGQGDTVNVIEHNMDVIKSGDGGIDMWADGGDGGGLVVAEGTPETVADVAGSHTGSYLARLLKKAR